MSYEQALALTVSPVVEGNDNTTPLDSGNWTSGVVGVGQCLGTRNGMSAAFLWSLPPSDPYHQRDPLTLTPADISTIYKAYFWDVMQLDNLPPAVAGMMFDCAVNQGQGWAPKCLQTACGAVADGYVGAKTIAAATKMDQRTLLATIGWLRDIRYHADPDFATDGHGWIIRLFRVTAAVMEFT